MKYKLKLFIISLKSGIKISPRCDKSKSKLEFVYVKITFDYISIIVKFIKTLM